MSTLTIQVPDSLRDLGYSNEEMCREVPILLVLRRFRQGAISSGKAANVLGMTRHEFLDLLGREGIPIYEPTDEQFADELKTIERLEKTKP